MSMNHIYSHRVLLASMEQSAALSTSGSEDSSMAGISTSKMRSLPRSDIHIHLDGHYNSRVYNSSSPVSGKVNITTKRNVRFDTVQILLVGTTTTKVEGLNAPQHVKHTFMKLAMPMPESAYPVPRVMDSGRTYSFPFNFVIPQHLTINACNHNLQLGRVQEQHLQLPPTLGFWDKDDMAPDMARVEYTIKARVFRDPEVGGAKTKVMEASQQIRVLPSSEEEPPLNLSKNDRLYTMSKSKTLRKNILAGKLGRVTATAVQSPAVILQPDGRGASKASTQIQLTFEPVSPDVAPPKISGISSKITAHTFFSSGTISTLPNLGEWTKQIGGERRGSYTSSVNAPCFQPQSASWQLQVGGPRRDSGYSSNSPEPTSESDSISLSDDEHREARQRLNAHARRPSSPVSYITTLQLPTALPTAKKTFVPTFHSCIASRVYVLRLSVGIGSGGSTTNISLAVPLQVVVDASNIREDLGDLPSFETAVGEAEADEMLRPRVLQVPQGQFRETSTLPGYGDSRG